MGNRYIISDTHFGHKNIANFRKVEKPGGGLYTSEELHEMVFEKLARINKKDTLFLLGDIVFNKEWCDRLKTLRCKDKRLYLGNHDLQYDGDMQDLFQTFEYVAGIKSYKRHWLSHAPVHHAELRGRASVHGHTHYHLMVDELGEIDKSYINVCCEYTECGPIRWEYATAEEYQQECAKLWSEYKSRGMVT